MRWWGKAVGGAAGFAFLGPVGAVVGSIVGHGFDKGLALELDRGPRPRVSAYPFREALLEATFSIMGHLAIRDGQVSMAEKSAVNHIIGELDLKGVRERNAWQSFELGTRRDFALDRQLARLREICNGRRDLLRAFLDMQMRLALADGGISGTTRLALKAMCRKLGISPIEFAQTEALARVRAGARRATAITRDDGPLQKARQVLGIDAGADEAAIKQAYRRLMNRHHPDKLTSQGLSDAAMAQARQRTHEIRVAYETLMQAQKS